MAEDMSVKGLSVLGGRNAAREETLLKNREVKRGSIKRGGKRHNGSPCTNGHVKRKKTSSSRKEVQERRTLEEKHGHLGTQL